MFLGNQRLLQQHVLLVTVISANIRHSMERACDNGTIAFGLHNQDFWHIVQDYFGD